MSQLEQQMRHRDRDMVPRALVVAMFGLMVFTLLLVSFAVYTDRPTIGITYMPEVEEVVVISMIGDRNGTYTVVNENGDQIGHSGQDKAGFLGVIGRTFKHRRTVDQVDLNGPLEVWRRTNGRPAVHDPSTGLTVELIGYGQDNVAAFARLLD